MKAFVGVLDKDCFNFLARPWRQPSFPRSKSGRSPSFKLHAPENFIVGGEFFAHNTLFPISLAWDAFREKNGAASFQEMRSFIERKRQVFLASDYEIGCILLEQPFFFRQEDRIPAPED